jgi:hypothetical protein
MPVHNLERAELDAGPLNVTRDGTSSHVYPVLPETLPQVLLILRVLDCRGRHVATSMVEVSRRMRRRLTNGCFTAQHLPCERRPWRKPDLGGAKPLRSFPTPYYTFKLTHYRVTQVLIRHAEASDERDKRDVLGWTKAWMAGLRPVMTGLDGGTTLEEVVSNDLLAVVSAPAGVAFLCGC